MNPEAEVREFPTRKPISEMCCEPTLTGVEVRCWSMAHQNWSAFVIDYCLDSGAEAISATGEQHHCVWCAKDLPVFNIEGGVAASPLAPR